MALVEVYISNGEPNQSIAIKDGETHTLELTPTELEYLDACISTLQTEDNTNCGWLIQNPIKAGLYLKQPDIDNNVTCCDKGGNITDDNAVYSILNDLVTSILNRI